MYSCKVVADSIMNHNHRCSSLVITIPRIVLAEFNTHCILSRNSASSRAIPFNKMIMSVQENPFVPIKWMKEHKGMQGSEYLQNEDWAKNIWLKGRRLASDVAEQLNDNGKGVTKQICNRLIEPFAWHTILVTATEWENFIALRAHSAAEMHIEKIAYMMLDALNNSNPKRLGFHEWHMPYDDDITAEKVLDQLNGTPFFDEFYNNPNLVRAKISAARCAQTSYTVVGEDGKEMNFVKLLELQNKLSSMGHMSPFEHCARTMNNLEYNSLVKTVPVFEGDKIMGTVTERGWCGKLRGFIPFRSMFKNENRSDERLIKKIF